MAKDPPDNVCPHHSGIEARLDSTEKDIDEVKQTQDRIFVKLDKIVDKALNRIGPGTALAITLLASAVVGLAVAFLKK